MIDTHFHFLSTTPMWTYITTYNAPYLYTYLIYLGLILEDHLYVRTQYFWPGLWLLSVLNWWPAWPSIVQEIATDIIYEQKKINHKFGEETQCKKGRIWSKIQCNVNKQQWGNMRSVSSAWSAEVDQIHTLGWQGSVQPSLKWWVSTLTKTELFLPRRMNMQHMTTWK